MNERRLHHIFEKYIDKFAEINNSSHEEYYKWQIAEKFRPLMDDALTSSADEFSQKLYEVKKLTANLIDSYTTPFYGLVKFSEQEPETVQNMFRTLYASNICTVGEKQQLISDFLRKSWELREKYEPDSFLYKDDMHSVTGYMFLYDPDHNYFFKASHALIFADCIEFYEDWGSGENIKLDVYYRMCDWLVEEIKKDNALLTTNASRFEDEIIQKKGKLFPDEEKHILAFDLIYCCSAYGLYSGIDFNRPKPKERQLMQEKKEKATTLLSQYLEAKTRQSDLKHVKEVINSSLTVGSKVHHKQYGEGIVVENNDSRITVDFGEAGTKKLGIFQSLCKNIIHINYDGEASELSQYIELLKREDAINTAVGFKERELSDYIEYLE